MYAKFLLIFLVSSLFFYSMYIFMELCHSQQREYEQSYNAIVGTIHIARKFSQHFVTSIDLQFHKMWSHRIQNFIFVMFFYYRMLFFFFFLSNNVTVISISKFDPIHTKTTQLLCLQRRFSLVYVCKLYI